MKSKPGNLARLVQDRDPAALAAVCVVHEATVYRWQDGSCLPHPRKAPVLAAALGVPVETVRQAIRADRALRKKRSS